ncbi:MAG: L,D-transpeptidase [Comamonadaceae bacterium]|nr:MAG: L,D-transpeptidase [Comamonadaceae bacterium]
MSARRRWLRHAAGCTAGFALAALAQPSAAEGRDFLSTRPSAEAQSLVAWVQRSGDAAGRPYAVVDKRHARIYVFGADGRLAGYSPALLGSTFGDHIVPGVGERAQIGAVRDDERTTPAGRFDARAGRNDKGEHVVWVDYDSAFAIHRLRPGFAYSARSTRLATVGATDKRVSWGCVVVPVPFYTGVVERVLGAGRSVVYVMPEVRPLHALFERVASR